MKTIYKYPLKITDIQSVEIPEFAKLLTVQTQHGELYLWALVETSNWMRLRKIVILGTGNPIAENDELSYISSVKMLETLIWHIFEKTN